jgi:predicted MFS family arabinose efflux permease
MNNQSEGALAFARENSRLLLGVFAAFLLGNLTHSLSPLMVGALVNTLGYTKGAAGYIVSAEFIGIALAALAVGPRVRRISKRNAAIMGCVIAICLHIVCIFVDSYNALLVLRFLAGFFAGIGLAAGSAAVASSIEPDRIFALVKMSNALVMAAMVICAGWIIGEIGMSGGWITLAGFSLLLLPFLLVLPHKTKEEKSEELVVEKSAMPNPVQGTMAVTGLIIWLSGSGFCFVYNSFIAEQSGFDMQNFSVLLAVGKIIGMAGGLTAAIIGIRHGRSFPLIIGISINAVTWLIITMYSSPVIYSVGLALNYISYFFVLPYVLGTSASVDSNGSWAAVASTTLLASLAISPIVGGLLVDHYGLVGLGVGTLVFEFLGLFLLLFAIKSLKALKLKTAQNAT